MELNESAAQAEAPGDEVSGSWHRAGGDTGSGIPQPEAFYEGWHLHGHAGDLVPVSEPERHRQNVIKPWQTNTTIAENEMIYELQYPHNSYNNQNT